MTELPVVEIIDVDAFEDDEVEYHGFRRDETKSKLHMRELEEKGVVYVGHYDRKNWDPLRKQLAAAHKKKLEVTVPPVVIDLLDSTDEDRLHRDNSPPTLQPARGPAQPVSTYAISYTYHCPTM